MRPSLDLRIARFRRWKLLRSWRSSSLRKLTLQLHAKAVATYAHLTRQRRIDLNARCPGCGHKQGRIEFSLLDAMIKHTCNICRATWAVDPIVSAATWFNLPK